jgi:hypothetical protein
MHRAQYVRVYTASVRLVYRGKVQCSDTLSGLVTPYSRFVSRGRGTGLTLPESGVTCVRVFTASVRLIYRGKVQCSDTLRTGSDETRQDHPDEIEVRSDRMGSCQVRSGQVHTMHVRTTLFCYIQYMCKHNSAESETNNACVRGQTR